MTADEVIKQCKVDDNKVYLPDITLDRKTYMDVAKKLNLAGGAWKGGKIKAFVFSSDPSEALGILKEGGKVNPKQKFQFFATPPKLADKLVELANLDEMDRILEPSAGQAAIIEAIHRAIKPFHEVCYYELMELNRSFLAKVPNTCYMGDDFLKHTGEMYDKIIANPPFSKNQDIAHVREMYKVLSFGGRLVSITSSHWEHSSNKKETVFREWLNEVGADIYDIEPGAFKESGTTVGGKIIVINK
jgi:phospholipid N-methyltransferase